MTPSLERARRLIKQGRHRQAEGELRGVLGDFPTLAPAHMLLALCLVVRDQYEEATQEAELAIHLEPDEASGYYVLGIVLILRNRHNEAKEPLLRAVELNPYMHSAFGSLAEVAFAAGNWKETEDYANAGLEVNPDSRDCLKMRTLALEKQGKVQEAIDLAGHTISQHPEDADAHATLGLAHLAASDYKRAQDCFREALRLDPDCDMARQGMVDALNSRSIIFRLVYMYYTAMARLPKVAQYGIIIGLYILQRGLLSAADTVPALQPFIIPVLVLLVGFVVLTWIITPLFNTFLRFNQYGRYLLSRDQIVSSNWLAGIMLAGVAAMLFSGVVLGSWIYAAMWLGYSIIIMMPVSGIFFCDRGWPRWIMTGVTVVVAALGVWILLTPFILGEFDTSLLSVFVIGNIGSQFLANILGEQKVRL